MTFKSGRPGCEFQLYHSFIQKYLLRLYHVSGIVLSAGIKQNKAKIPPFMKLTRKWNDMDIKRDK